MSRLTTTFKLALLASTAFTLAACGESKTGEPLPEPEASERAASGWAMPGYDQLLSAAPSASGTTVTVDAISGLFPEGFDISWSDAQADEGVTRFTDFSVSAADSDIALTASTLDIYGADIAALTSLIAGEAGTGTPFFERLDANGLAMVGLEAAFQPMMDPVNEMMLEDFGASDIEFIDPTTTFESYTLEAERLVIDRMVQHALPEIGTPADDEDERAFQDVARHIASWSVDAIVLSGVTSGLSYTQYGAEVSQAYEIDLIGYRGFDRGNLASSDVIGMRSTGTLPLPTAASFNPDASKMKTKPVEITTTLGSLSWSGIEMRRVLDYVIAGTPPPTSETGLFSLGTLEMVDTAYTFEGQDFFSADRLRLDLSEWHWLIPERVSLSMDQLVYDYTALSPYLKDLMLSELDAEMQQAGWADSIDSILDLVERDGIFSTPSDGELLWAWSKDTGDADFEYSTETEGFFSQDMGIAGKLPPYEDWAPLLDFSEDELSPKAEAALEDAFRNDARFDGAHIRMVDEGGLDTLFQLAVDIADVLPQDNPQVQVFASYEVDDLKTMLTGMMLMGVNQAAQEFPPARGYGNAVVDWIKEGGMLELVVKPAEPVTAETVEAFDLLHEGDPSPDAVIDFFGVDVRHTPAD
ncbi:MAG: hypothetical protein AAF216_02425 [Pseudomonadota bacterium]